MVTFLKGIIKSYGRNKSIKTATFFSLSSSVLSFSNMIAGILVIRWLTPEELGLWNSIYIALYYVSFLQLGMFNALNREMPYYLGKGERNFALSLVSTTQWHARFLSILVLAISALVVFIALTTRPVDRITLFSIANLGLVISLQLYINFLTVTYRANRSFRSLSFINLAQALVILLSLYVVYLFRYEGYVIRFVLLSLSLLLMMYFQRPYKLKSSFSLSNYKLLLSTGIPLFALLFLVNITDTFNRLILLKVSDYESVGLYYPAIAIIVAMKVFPGSISQFLYPKMSFEVGNTNDLEKIWGWCWKTLVIIISFMLPVAIIGYFFLPSLIDKFFSNYSESLFAARLALFSGVLSGSFIIITVFSSLKSWKELTILAVLKVLLYFSLQYFFAMRMIPINGVAVGTLIADLIFLVVLVYFTWYVLIRKNRI